MSNCEYRHFLVTGGVIMERHKKWLEIYNAQVALRSAFVQAHHADNTFGNRREVVGLVYDSGSAPDGWKPYNKYHDVFCPTSKTAEGRKLRKFMRSLALVDAAEYHDLMCDGKGGYGFGNFSEGVIRTYYIVFELIGDTVVLKVPAIETGLKWTPPDEFCKELKTSEFYALKEKHEEENKAA